MQVELKKIQLGSLIKSVLPLVLLTIGVVGGLFTFILFPDQSLAARLPQMFQRNIAAGVFALAYTAATILFLVIVALLYNILISLGLPGVKVVLASPPETPGGPSEEA